MDPKPPFAVVLGTAQDGGVPHFGCVCAHCMAAVADPSRRRRVACLGIVTREGTVLVDATPDLPVQQRELARVADRTADEPPRAVFLTHLHAGHILGLPMFGREGWAATRTPVWATETSLRILESNEPFAALFREGHLVSRVLHLGWDASLDDVVVQAVPVPHRSELGDTVAYRIEGPGRSLFYAPDLDALVPDVIAQVRGADISIVDGTFFRKRELTRGDADLVPHPAIADSMSALAHLGRRIVFTHLNHTNPVLDPESRERQAVEALGMRIAQEGEIIPLAD